MRNQLNFDLYNIFMDDEFDEEGMKKKLNKSNIEVEGILENRKAECYQFLKIVDFTYNKKLHEYNDFIRKNPQFADPEDIDEQEIGDKRKKSAPLAKKVATKRQRQYSDDED